LVLNNQGARIITQSGKFVKSSGLCYSDCSINGRIGVE
jgi:hypothetical protein